MLDLVDQGFNVQELQMPESENALCLDQEKKLEQEKKTEQEDKIQNYLLRLAGSDYLSGKKSSYIILWSGLWLS